MTSTRRAPARGGGTDTADRTPPPAPSPEPGDGQHSFVGTGTLVRLALRRDRLMVPIWLGVLFLFTISSSLSVKDLFGSAASRDQLAGSAGATPATVAMYGPSWDVGTLGGLSTWKMNTMGTVLLGLLSIFVVTRHTRGDEEPGRLELIRAGVAGRYSALTAGVLVALLTNLVSIPLVALGLMAGSVGAGPSFGYALALALVGVVFTGLAALTAQLTESSRAANGIAAAVLAVAFLLRALGDTTSQLSWLDWLSPMGWLVRFRAFAPQPHWWVLAPPLVALVALLVIGYLLAGRRDLGAGLLPARLGRPAASRALSGPFGLAWRLHRGTLLGWSIGFAVLGGALGSVSNGLDDFAASKGVRDMLQALGGQQALVDSYLSFCMALAALVVSVYLVQSLLRMRTEETAYRAEPVLATPVGRLRWAASHLTVAVLGGAWLLVLMGLFAGLGRGGDDVGHQIGRLLGAALAQLPAALVLAGITIALIGLLPRWSVAAWGLLGLFVAIGQFGDLLKLNQRVRDISPFTHTPTLPGGTPTAMPLIVLSVVAIALTAVGLLGLRRRDIGAA